MTKTKIARIVTASLAILVVVSGVFGTLHYAGICTLDVWQVSATNSLGWLLRSLNADQIPVTCPLGFLERSLAVRELLPQWYVSVAIVVLSVLLLGRVFCAWVCPAGLIQRIFRGKGGSGPRRETVPKGKGIDWAPYSSYAVLGGVLFASFLFRFPVFCLFCPIGLFFGALYAVIRLFSPQPLSVELVVFPVLLGLELFALKSWCRSFCPLGALLSLPSVLNRFFRPAIKQETCLASKGINCQACKNACPEGANLRNPKRGLFVNDCTKCLECSDRCPVKAIKISLWA